MSWSDDLQRLIDAMEFAEGGPDAFIRAVRCSMPSVGTVEDARTVAKNTILHRLWDYAMQNGPDDFIDFLAARWAPVGAGNDPQNLNANWPRNVKALYAKVRGV